MKITDTRIPDVKIIEPNVFEDDRGYFFEAYRESILKEAGIDEHFVQDNVSKSYHNTVRGLHYQIVNPQAKLVRVIRGRVLDVAVDLRKNSPTFGQHVAVELTEDNHLQFFIPHGFAHGFAVLSGHAVFAYKCDDYYHPECEDGVAWDDPDLAIDWKIKPQDAIVSEKDKKNPLLRDVESISL